MTNRYKYDLWRLKNKERYTFNMYKWRWDNIDKYNLYMKNYMKLYRHNKKFKIYKKRKTKPVLIEPPFILNRGEYILEFP